MEHIPDKIKATTNFVKDHDHFLTKPMFEVFSVTIHSKDNTAESLRDGKPCHLRGIVRVLDEEGRTYDLYNRTSNNLEIINLGGFLSLTNFNIIPSKVLQVTIMLYDVAHDIEIAHGVFDLDYSKSYDYNKVHITKVDGEHGFASIYHSTFQHAVIASVERVEFRMNVGASDPNNHMCGTVIARLKRIYGHSPPDDINNHEYPNTILFDNRQYSKQSMNVQAQFNAPVELFRSRLVVPVDCSLIIEADFCDDNGRKFAANIQLNPTPQGLNKGSITSQNCEMLVEVDWRHAYDAFPSETKVKDSVCAFLEEESTSNLGSEPNSQLEALTLSAETINDTKFTLEAQPPSSSISRRQPCAAIPILSSCVEVFSVLICVEDKDLEIFGTIEISDSACCPFYIFNGHERLGDGKTLSIVGPARSFNDKPFSMRVDLKDGKGRVVTKGSIDWNCNDDDLISLYDRHICSVILGDIGYAAIHYSMITYGVQVGIKLSFVSPSDHAYYVNVYGTITAWYKSYGYPTLYDEQYYKSTLYSRSPEECARVEISRNSSFPLLKSWVSVPLEDSLILDVNLKVVRPLKDGDDKGMTNVGGENASFDHMQALVEFNADIGRYFIIDKLYRISVSTDVEKVGLP